jgi:hypothetical protein
VLDGAAFDPCIAYDCFASAVRTMEAVTTDKSCYTHDLQRLSRIGCALSARGFLSQERTNH